MVIDAGVEGDLYAKTLSAPPGTTFWLPPGTHLLAPDQFGQVIPKTGNIYIGAPGAVLDGSGQPRRFHPAGQGRRHPQPDHPELRRRRRTQGVVNHDAGTHWTINDNTITDNAGAGVFAGAGRHVPATACPTTASTASPPTTPPRRSPTSPSTATRSPATTSTTGKPATRLRLHRRRQILGHPRRHRPRQLRPRQPRRRAVGRHQQHRFPVRRTTTSPATTPKASCTRSATTPSSPTTPSAATTSWPAKAGARRAATTSPPAAVYLSESGGEPRVPGPHRPVLHI